MSFLERGYTIADASDRDALDRIRALVADAIADFLGLPQPAGDIGAFLDKAAADLSVDRLNEARLAVISAIERTPWFRAAYYACGKALLDDLVGNELAMQRSVGFSIQLPNDESSLLPLHSDVWSEDSPFEAVLWIPLVDVANTKSMFIIPHERDEKWRGRMHEFSSVEQFFAQLEPDAEFLQVNYGQVLVFTHTLMHGNRVNREEAARWSLNVRFKGLFTPYADKRLGDFFEPLNIRPITRIGMRYQHPDGFRE